MRKEANVIVKTITGTMKKTFRLTKRYNMLLGIVGSNIKYETFTKEEKDILEIFSKNSVFSMAEIHKMYLKTKRSYDKVRWLIHKSSELNMSWEQLFESSVKQ